MDEGNFSTVGQSHFISDKELEAPAKARRDRLLVEWATLSTACRQLEMPIRDVMCRRGLPTTSEYGIGSRYKDRPDASPMVALLRKRMQEIQRELLPESRVK